jgi:ATPase subunit of ABC transporter with duplicated ATPase domains
VDRTRTLDGGFKAFESWRDAILEQEESERHKLGRKIAMEEDWLRYGVTARRTRNQRRLAELHALRKKRREQRAAQGTVRLEAAQADSSGRLVAVAQGISKSYGGRPIVRIYMRGLRLITAHGKFTAGNPLSRYFPSLCRAGLLQWVSSAGALRATCQS